MLLVLVVVSYYRDCPVSPQTILISPQAISKSVVVVAVVVLLLLVVVVVASYYRVYRRHWSAHRQS